MIIKSDKENDQTKKQKEMKSLHNGELKSDDLNKIIGNNCLGNRVNNYTNNFETTLSIAKQTKEIFRTNRIFKVHIQNNLS